MVQEGAIEAVAVDETRAIVQLKGRLTVLVFTRLSVDGRRRLYDLRSDGRIEWTNDVQHTKSANAQIVAKRGALSMSYVKT